MKQAKLKQAVETQKIITNLDLMNESANNKFENSPTIKIKSVASVSPDKNINKHIKQHNNKKEK